MTRRTMLTLLSVALVATAVGPASAGTELVIAGSTTVQKRVLEPAAAAITAATGVTVTVRGINSGKGFEELRQGKVTVAASSNPLPALLEKAGIPNDTSFVETVITRDTITPIVHPQNPVSSLTWQQLADLHSGKITNWKDVGGPDQAVVVVTSQPDAATRLVFQDMVMKEAKYAAGARVVQSTRQEVDLVSQFKGGIGAVSEAFVKMNPGKVKVVKTDAISRPLSLITKGKPGPDVQKVIDFLKSPEGQKLIK